MVNFNHIPDAALVDVLTFIPEQSYQFATLSKSCLNVTRDSSFIFPYFQELSKELGEERLSQLFGRPTWDSSKASLNELTTKICQYARTTVFGEALLRTQPPHEMFSASELATIVKLRDQEEDENLVKMASRLPFLDTSALYANIEDTGKEDLSSLKAQAVRKAIATMSDAKRRDITFLDLSNLELTSIPKEIFLFANLVLLKLEHNQLRTLPAEVGNLINLQYLSLWNNQLRTLPAKLSNLINLQNLGLSNNQLRTLPAELGNLINLQSLGRVCKTL